MALRVEQRRRSEVGLLFVAVVVILFAYLLASLGTYDRLPPNVLEFIGVLAAIALFVNVANRFLAPQADPVIMPVVLMLNGIGFVMIYRLNDPVDAPWHYQAIWTVLGMRCLRRDAGCRPPIARPRALPLPARVRRSRSPRATARALPREHARISADRSEVVDPCGTGHVSTGRVSQAHARDLLRVLFRGEKGNALALDAAGWEPPVARSPPSRADRSGVGRVVARHPLRARHRLLPAALRDVHCDTVGGHRALDLCRRRTHRVRGRHLPCGSSSLCEDLDRRSE